MRQIDRHEQASHFRDGQRDQVELLFSQRARRGEGTANASVSAKRIAASVE